MSMTKITIDTTLTARQIMETYDVPKSTAYRAKKKGFYLQRKQVMDPATPKQHARFMAICALPPLTNSNLRSVTVQKYYDIERGKSKLSKMEWMAFRVEILTLRVQLRNFVKTPNIFTFKICIFANPLVKHHLLFKNRSMVERFRSGVEIPDKEFQLYADNVNKFVKALRT